MSSYVIRRATRDDAAALRRLAALDSQRPLAGTVLVGEIGGAPVAALSLTSGRAVADPFRRTATMLEHLRVHAAQAGAPAAPQRRPRAFLRLRIRSQRLSSASIRPRPVALRTP